MVAFRIDCLSRERPCMGREADVYQFNKRLASSLGSMLDHIKPWSLYPNRSPAISQGRITLIEAFADLVHFRSGFSSYEFPEIFEAPEDEGENDACRDLVRLHAEIFAEQFIMADIGTFAR